MNFTDESTESDDESLPLKKVKTKEKKRKERAERKIQKPKEAAPAESEALAAANALPAAEASKRLKTGGVTGGVVDFEDMSKVYQRVEENLSDFELVRIKQAGAKAIAQKKIELELLQLEVEIDAQRQIIKNNK